MVNLLLLLLLPVELNRYSTVSSDSHSHPFAIFIENIQYQYYSHLITVLLFFFFLSFTHKKQTGHEIPYYWRQLTSFALIRIIIDEEIDDSRHTMTMNYDDHLLRFGFAFSFYEYESWFVSVSCFKPNIIYHYQYIIRYNCSSMYLNNIIDLP